jgi:ribosomal protein L7Ae-like RNA K-turn-binding protein
VRVVGDGVAATTERGTVDERRVLALIGLGVRGRMVVVGVERVRDAAFRGTLALAIVAPDASPNSLQKVLPLLRAKRVEVIEGPGAAALGAAVGRDAAAAVGITDRDLARGIRAAARSGSRRAQ